ncbi:hypothetical protein [Roseateles chitinivorans]|uniref:hypothetical protein n=1 Tax=Roseateles chitinivorans TaxID=2917965 RepID=UPI00117D5F7E|nr:hypothetical protein [Roseateles chitinivorans]
MSNNNEEPGQLQLPFDRDLPTGMRSNVFLFRRKSETNSQSPTIGGGVEGGNRDAALEEEILKRVIARASKLDW